MRNVTALAASVALAGLGSCKDKAPQPVAGSEAPWASAGPNMAPRPGMVWIEQGTLRAGTPLERVPRLPDAELAGQPFELTGFFIDVFPHPNEPGAIPTTNVTRQVAQELCESAGKRLCTELELERACKGPDNWAYPYGDRYREDVCATGRGGDSLVPNGLSAACVSPFGVHDTHGTIWVWTSSDYGRGSQGLAVIKGGNSAHGELVGRCAHVRAQRPDVPSPSLGVRCCMGPMNPAKVELEVSRGAPLSYRRDDEVTKDKFERSIRELVKLREGEPEVGPASDDGPTRFQVERVWSWHPLGNEALYVAGGCAQPPPAKVCGVFVGRATPDGIKLLAFASSDRWQPTLAQSEEGRVLLVMGGDEHGAFRKGLAWEWGKVTVFAKERKKGKNRWGD